MEIESRQRQIIKTGIIGIIANLILSGTKVGLGFISGSIAITMDGINNLTDSLSSVVTIIGTLIANRKPDKKHPMGHGRIEYIAGMVVAVIVLYAGVAASIESIKKIINPTKPSYTNMILGIMLLAVVVKIFLGNYTQKKGIELNSDSLKASGVDAKMDAVISTATIIAGLIYMFRGVGIESWLALGISFVVIKAGVDSIMEASSNIVGERPERELTDSIKRTIMEFEGVEGVYDLIINNYGPEMVIGSAHIEIPDYWNAGMIDDIERKIADRILNEYGILMAAIGIYSINTTDDMAQEIKHSITKMVMSREHILQMHGFHLDSENKVINFDLIMDFDCVNKEEILEEMKIRVMEKYRDYEVRITLDLDTTD
ncbi:Cadmium, cobalt and zinc/H(+)-K(+) antiporter [Peptostreptococcus anaerobius]|uniref:Cadmium, cobalt and zinc/H(+)-K(+) antiporter n=1 Tax=Peptostreptococcus anaerobius TaxID=1261 RepID=A0A379CG71_9FIRM|nr:cation diffusion facilitator family transporter [Peptostreptococcus anaerobius]EKX94796.1 cation diffusion facilitator family transporter [Peptostreptococcus anaerobius VPI 4330 = DSM 2949]MDB8822021.1 cation diffusion facilitator family transporter [Peptostreptococcus anaerobius]MDB8826684.1 cation diffusion facilitator family transporter [Peptostreptococcus anaerobius]MDB8828516.1 cation diffusion facilitator family transporter [Peptostreptococcus anaerobius]MDB8830317.1 cation diffusion 